MTNATEFSLTLADEVASESFAAQLAKCARAGDCILLEGELGAGKTTLARGFIRALAGEVEVTSPTFTLLQTYPTQGGCEIWHFDLYRLRDATELAELGIEQALEGGIVLIEWPEIAAALLPDDALHLHLFAPAQGGRRLVGKAGGRWYTRLKQHGVIT